MEGNPEMRKWVSDEIRKRAEPDKYGRTWPFAVYVQYERGEVVRRNLSLTDAEAMAGKYAAEGLQVHVEVDVCG